MAPVVETSPVALYERTFQMVLLERTI